MPASLHLLQQDGGLGQMLLMLLPIFLIFYFLVLRPQSKERRLQMELRSSLKKGDRVLCQSGIIARVHSVHDMEVVLALEGNARMRVAKESVIRRLDEGKGEGGSSGEISSEKAAEAS